MFFMTIFPRGRDENPNDALFRKETNAPVSAPDADLDRTQVVEPQPSAIPEPTRQIGKLRTNYIALFIEDSQQPLILEVSQDTMIGRHTPEQTLKPRVDLTSFNAREKGVSRLHAVIRRTPTSLEVWDLASSNGTKLNDVDLEPYIPVQLKSGDHLKLGNLDIEVRFDS
jgi:pSer/pThr/pTyr-binding forkhead associated (FHA) protein